MKRPPLPYVVVRALEERWYLQCRLAREPHRRDELQKRIADVGRRLHNHATKRGVAHDRV